VKVWITGASGAIGKTIQGMLFEHETFTEWVNVRDQEQLDKYAQSLPSLDALVYAAGVNILEWSSNIVDTDMNYVYDVNVTGLIRCLQAAPEITKCVVIGSDAATKPMRTSVIYNASKAALNAAVKCIARERASNHFQINVVSPGLIVGTDMTEAVYQRTKELRPDLDLDSYMVGQIPMGRPGSPGDVARVVRWLLEDAPAYLNGSIIEVNGAR